MVVLLVVSATLSSRDSLQRDVPREYFVVVLFVPLLLPFGFLCLFFASSSLLGPVRFATFALIEPDLLCGESVVVRVRPSAYGVLECAVSASLVITMSTKSASKNAAQATAKSKAPAKPAVNASKQSSTGLWLLGWAIKLPIIAWILHQAYTIRLYAIKNYGLVIHEFDPWFNFRATQYLADNGWQKFFSWFDYMSWYPLGRPVGTTIYPGMQITSVAIFDFLKSLGPEYEMSLNDVCCYVPAWFGVSATAFVGLLTYESMKSSTMAIAAAAIMAIVPAHIMRSVGGGYDNESIAMTAMCATFYFWVKSVSGKQFSWIWGILSGLAYFYMVATWGGYIFVLNMIALHALILAATTSGLKGQTSIYLAYTVFYIVGTSLAIQVRW